MASEANLGQLLDETAQRDAIHVAIAPVVAAGMLKPGSHISILPDGRAGYSTSAIGIVDPFLKEDLREGDRFYMVLYPRTITSLRHDWTHPAFSPSADKEDARLRIELVAIECGLTYERLMETADSFAESGDYEYDNSERYKNCDWERFWKDWETVTGRKAPEDAWAPFICSC